MHEVSASRKTAVIKDHKPIYKDLVSHSFGILRNMQQRAASIVICILYEP